MRRRATAALIVFLFMAAPHAEASFKAFTPTGDGVSHPSEADGRVTATPSIHAYRISESERIRMDGRLDDPAWQNAEAGRGFKVWEPDRGSLPSEETVFKTAYDQDAIYFAVACLERDPAKISSHLSRRDRFSKSDIVSIYIDPYFDRTTGYNFKINPLGVLLDSYMYNDGDRDDDWDAVWQAQTYQDAEGWYVEVRIPFSAIRYRTADSMTWGLEVYRYMHGRGEDTAWVTWDRNTRGFISRFGQVTGIEGIRPPRQLEVLPYVVGRTTDPSTGAPPDRLEKFENVGADLKYGVTTDLTLNATVQPDFGQIEADPAVLNLSPFETFYNEKRPFFVEGSRFFQHPDFNLFYSRRIGTGDPNSRIRYAGKLTGKAAGNVTVAALVASSDVTGTGQAHNLLKNGDRLSRYFVGRLGKEFSGGRHRFHLMQTAVVNTANRDVFGEYASREAYTTGADFDLNFHNRDYNIQGSVVTSVVDPEGSASDASVNGAARYGSGGSLDIRRLGGKWRGGVNGRWESAKLDLNDLGFLEAPDEMGTSLFLSHTYNPEGKSKVFNRADFNLNVWKNWLYAGRQGFDVNTGALVWSYGRGHKQWMGTELNGWMQFRNYQEAWWGVNYQTEGTRRYETRGGPLMREPLTFGGWAGFNTDSRKNFVLRLEGNHFRDVTKNHDTNAEIGLQWNQSSAVSHEMEVSFHNRQDDTQYLETVDLALRPYGMGIGGLSYVFGRIHQRTASLTLRTNLLFSRDKSLEIYAQPFLTVGDYSGLRELAKADSYEFIPYVEPGVEARNYDFSYAAVNWNAVYRWEYRPGSTFFLVWTQARSEAETRGASPGSFDNDLRLSSLFHNEPENKVLAKVTYWLAI
ncbi:MAG: carbohydrate binding family 9 domain-containing protein [Candidatus Latescibacteria bacterium]|nr:carbohydrate binding family 9 domain-containing protein [Candidatus Latescibacterota bacterium]